MIKYGIIPGIDPHRHSLRSFVSVNGVAVTLGLPSLLRLT